VYIIIIFLISGVQETQNTRRNRQPVGGVYAGVQETESTSDDGQHVDIVHVDDVVDELPLPDLPGCPRAGQARNAHGNYSELHPGIAVLCKTEDIPVYIRSRYRIYDRIVVLNKPKDEVVPSGNRLTARTFAVSYGMRPVKWSQWSDLSLVNTAADGNSA
ncbi:uncharacterized protein LOC132727534, partial [Ruditapes philippinarum]|uniref:uncharacterized protein LOC132727534 n=1 Tax=Ruditapes philippinarum TaxID=129788 RepID=UPI00295B067D